MEAWHEGLRPYEHYVPVDANLRNLSEAVLWARAHDEEAKRIVRAANAATRELLQPSAMFRYAEEVLLGYVRLMRYRPALHERAVPFVCEEDAPSSRTCSLHHVGSKPETVQVGETRCFFRSLRHPRQRFYTLYEAALGLPSSNSTQGVSVTVDAMGAHSPSVIQAMRRPDGHRSEA